MIEVLELSIEFSDFHYCDCLHGCTDSSV